MRAFAFGAVATSILALAGCLDTNHPGPSEPLRPELAGYIASGEDYACALIGTGSPICTGIVTVGQNNEGYISLSGGQQHACGIHQNGTARCWGVPSHGRTLVPFGTSFNHIVGGSLHGCGIVSDNTITCWGNNDFGQTDAPRGAFRRIAASAGGHHTCALDLEGTLTCWGLGSEGQTTGLPGSGFREVVATLDGGCALDGDGRILCWNEPLLDIQGAGYSGLSAGPDFVCALRDLAVHCFGPGTAAFTTPEGGNFKQVAAGYRHVCALRRDGHVICRGAVELFPGVAQ